MRLTSIELENFRCFEKEKIELHPQLNVFVGVNASGKTALLEGIAIGIGQFFQGMNIHRSMNFSIMPTDERQISTNGKNADRQVVRIKCSGYLDGYEDEKTWLIKYGESLTALESQNLTKLSYGIYSSIASGNEHDLPVISYLSTQRLWGGDDSEANQVQDLSGNVRKLGAYVDSLSKKSNTLHFEKELEQMQLVVSQGKEFGFAYDSSRLDLIRNIAAKVIQDCKIFYYDYEKQSLAVIFNDGRRLTIDELSDGQKSLLLISTSIAFQCGTLNPHMGLDAYKSNGVVLIDEVELHLHPDWQRQILPILTREFPNIQFICTTHSPQVLSTLNRENVQVIENFHVHPIDHYVRGRDSNAILSEVFGIEKRPKEFADQLQHFYALLEDNEYEKAKLVLEALEEIWGSMDSEIVRGWLFWADGQEVVLDDAEEVA